MQPDRVQSPPPGWYDDPTGSGRRWWDGEQWTTHTQPQGQPTLSHFRPRNPTPMDAWNGLMSGGRWVIVAVLLVAFVGLVVMLVATLGGASSATAQDIAAKVIVYGGLGLLGLRYLASR